jgi:hypothetical protein
VLWEGNGLTSPSSVADVLVLGNDGIARTLASSLQPGATFTTGSYANWVDVDALDDSRTVVVMATSGQVLTWFDGTHLHADGTPYVALQHPNVVDTSALAFEGYPVDPVAYLGGVSSPTLVAYEQGPSAVTMVGLDTSGIESWRTPLADGDQIASPGPYALDLTGDGFPDVLTGVWNINGLESLALFDGTTGTIVRSTPVATITPGGDALTTGSLVDVNGDGVPDLVNPAHDFGDVAVDLSVDPMRTIWTIAPATSAPVNGTIAAAAVDGQGTSLLRSNGNSGFGYYARYSTAGAVIATQDEQVLYNDRNAAALVLRSPGATVYDMISAGVANAGLSRVRRVAGDTLATVWSVYLAGGAVSPTQPAQAFALHDPVAVDVDGDGADEIVLGSDDGWLYALRSADGSAAFTLDLGAPVTHVIAADVDLDPQVELVASLGDGRLVAIDGAGKYQAIRDASGEGGASPCAGDGGADDYTPSHGACTCGTAIGSSSGGADALVLGLAGFTVALRRRARRPA